MRTLDRLRSRPMAVLIPAVLVMHATAAAQLNIPSDGSDGVFNPSGANFVVDLSQAATGHWSTPGNGNGVYDPDQWAVVFKYQSVNIPSGTTVRFLNHPSGAPVIWLVEDDVVINGAVILDGANGVASGTALYAVPGPGGFRGGRFNTTTLSSSAGFGPGGGGNVLNNSASGGGGGHAVAGGSGQSSGGVSYGNVGAYPLIGGSGGGGASGGTAGSGGGGAGAILIAASGHFTLSGTLRANGGDGGAVGGFVTSLRGGGGGSGGSIRVIAGVASGNGVLRANGGSGGIAWGGNGGAGSVGRIRVEALENFLLDSGDPQYSFGVPPTSPRIFREAETPIVRAVTLGGARIPLDPRSAFAFPADINLDEGGPTTLLIEAENMPPSGTMVVRLVRRTGASLTVPAKYVSGHPFLSTWQADVDLPQGFSAIQIRAVLPEDK